VPDVRGTKYTLRNDRGRLIVLVQYLPYTSASFQGAFSDAGLGCDLAECLVGSTSGVIKAAQFDIH
jgi:hypothetical protein